MKSAKDYRLFSEKELLLSGFFPLAMTMSGKIWSVSACNSMCFGV
jgi:hypothetical protein